MDQRGLFAEHQFRWPELPGNPEREAKLPWAWFTDPGEARSLLRRYWTLQGLSTLWFVNFWFVRHVVGGWLLFTATMVAQFAFMHVWIPLCKRTQPPMSKWDWWGANWLNPKSRHLLVLAWETVYRR